MDVKACARSALLCQYISDQGHPLAAGPPSKGSSMLLALLAGAATGGAASREFTVSTCIPNVIHDNDASSQA